MNASAPSPSITVLLPVHNDRNDFLVASIESILHQTYQDFELLLLDDASEEPSCLKTLSHYKNKDPRIRILRNTQNLGLTQTLNKGLHFAKGEFIARQDADDVSDPQRFQKQIDFLQKNPECILCGTWANILNEAGTKIGTQEGPTTWKKARKQILLINLFVHSSFFFRKSNILSLGGYSKDMKKAQDYDLLLKILPKHCALNIPEYLCSYRVSRKNITFGDNKSQERYALMARRRALKKYGYSWYESIKVLRPLFFYFCIPSIVKQYFMRLLWKI